MKEREFTAAVRIACPPEVAFDWVADHRNVPRVLEGISRWDPLDDRPGHRGARYQVEMRTLGLPLDGVLVIDRWTRPRAIAWRSESGLIRQRGGWTFTPVARRTGPAAEDPEGTEVTLTIAYAPPAGALGNLVAGRVDRIVRRRLERALEGMRDLLEEDGPGQA